MNLILKKNNLLIVFLLINCSVKSQSIIEISYNSVGGEMGGSISVRMTKDSINGNFSNLDKKIIIKEEVQETLWDSLTQSITLKDFKEIKSGKSIQYIDGIDISVKIVTGEESYTLLNGNIDEVKDKNVFHFMQVLEEELRRMYLHKID